MSAGFDAVEAQQHIEEARKASRAVYIAVESPVADDLSRILNGLASDLVLAVAEVTRLNSERDQALRIIDVTDNPNAEGWKLQRLHALFTEGSTEPESDPSK